MPTPSRRELLDQASRIHETLQADPVFEHFGEDSRGIFINPSPVGELRALAEQSRGGSSRVAFAGAVELLKFSTREGMYIRTKEGPEGCLAIDVRGAMPYFDQSATLGEFAAALMKRSGVEFLFDPEKPVTVEAHADFLKTVDGQEFDDSLNKLLEFVPEEQILAFTGGMLNLLEAKIRAITGA